MARRIPQLIVGLYLFGLGVAFLVRSSLGASSWDVLTQGLSHHVPLSFGTITVIMSGIVLLLWIPLRQKPGLGTVLNALLIGPSVDLSFLFVPETDILWLRMAYIAIGIALVGLGTGLYIGSRFGPGPRDGLMTALNRLTGLSIWKTRFSIELVVVIIGWALGGTVGIGTVAFTVLIGPSVQFFMQIFHVRLPSDPDFPIAIDPEPTQPQIEKAPNY